MTEPAQKKGRSKQDYSTPWDFIRAVEARFGPIVCDLAAHAGNKKCPRYFTEGVGTEPGALGGGSLTLPWAELHPMGTLWLNPPFADIDPWAEKCALEGPNRDGVIVMLTPASVDALWFAKHVDGRARVMPVAPRIPFEGGEPNPKTGTFDGYPKSLMLSVFGKATGGFEIWRWK